MDRKFEYDLAHWEVIRTKHLEVVWVSKYDSIKLIDMDDKHLLNVIKIVYERAKRSEDLPFIDEIQSYEGISYCTWLRYLTNEYKYRKALSDYRTELQFTQLKSYKDYLDDIPF